MDLSPMSLSSLRSIENSIIPDNIVPALSERGKVFISYSWDTPEHQKWVEKLASKLLRLGVSVAIDIWDTQGGEDIASFMAKQTQHSPLVICVCSDLYLEKARAAKQTGAKHETVLLDKRVSLKGANFILPIIKSSTQPEESKLLDFLPRSKYFDFTDSTKEALAFSELFARITNLNSYRKPSTDPLHNQKIQLIADWLVLVQNFWQTPENSTAEISFMQRLNSENASCTVLSPPCPPVEKTQSTLPPSPFVVNLLGGWDQTHSGDQHIIDQLMRDN